MTDCKIIFNSGNIGYDLKIPGDSTVRKFYTRDEAEFFYVKNYLNSKVEYYDDYSITYGNDGKNIDDILLRDGLLAKIDNSEDIKTTKELIYSAMKKYDKTEVSFVDKVDARTMGFMASGGNMVKVDLVDGKLVVEADITKDSIVDYYEFMGEEDKINFSHTLLNIEFTNRLDRITSELGILPSLLSDEGLMRTKYYKSNGTPSPEIYKDGKCLYYATDSGTIDVSYFGVKDTLKPINEYIIEIKESNGYKEYSSSIVEKKDLVGDYILDKDVPVDAGTEQNTELGV